MSASQELTDWVKTNRPQDLGWLQRASWADSIEYFNALTGLTIIPASAQRVDPDVVCRTYLIALGWYRPTVQAAPPAAPPGPRKPVPALPAEVHHTTNFNADRAWDAVAALCRGS